MDVERPMLNVRFLHMKEALIYQKVSHNEFPWELLLLADPSREQIAAYVERGESYLAQLDGRPVGMFALVANSSESFKLMNIAVDETSQGQGFGKQLLVKAISVARGQGARRLELGTGNSSLDQLVFYQKAGFRITGVIPDFFTDTYDEDIIENGIPCRDMIRLTLEL